MNTFAGDLHQPGRAGMLEQMLFGTIWTCRGLVPPPVLV